MKERMDEWNNQPRALKEIATKYVTTDETIVTSYYRANGKRILKYKNLQTG